MTPFGQQELVCFISVLMITVLVTNCGTGAGSNSQKVSMDGTWSTGTISETPINNLNTFEGFLYAASDSGLYKKNLENNKNDWNSIGLQTRQVIDLVFLPDHKLLAAVRLADCCSGIPSLFLSIDQGKSWQPYMNNFGGATGKYTWVKPITSAAKPSDTLFAQLGGGGIIARSFDGGKRWKVVNGEWNNWGGMGEFVYIDPYTNGTVWVGGTNGFLLPVLLKSKDHGKNWESLRKRINGQVEDLISKYDHSEHVLAGMKGGIRKSTDGGQNWNTVLKRIIANTLTHSARDPEIIYASGRNNDGTLFFAASRDFGDHWQTVTMTDSPAGIHVNDMVSVMQDGHEVLYLGTNKGVYRYHFEK